MRLIHGDCLDALRTLPDRSVDAVVTDPPAGIAFMGKTWDSDKGGRDLWIAWLAERLAECLRVLKPGGHAVVWALPRTSGWTHRALEDAGFDVRDCVHHLFGCLSEDTEIMVDGQWVPYQECANGRLALCYDNERDEFTWQPIEQVYVYPDYGDTAYRLRGDHTDQLVSREHRCLVERGGGYVFERAEDAAQERQARVPVLEDVHRLLSALPLPHSGASRTEGNVLADVPCSRNSGDATAAEATPSVPVVRRGVHTQEQPGLGEGEALLPRLRGEIEGRRPELVGADARGGGTRAEWLDRGQRSVVPGEDDRRAEPGMEGRSHLLPQARQLRADQVRPLPGGVHGDGPQGRLRHGASAPRSAGARPSATPAGGRASREPRLDGQPVGEPVPVRQQPGAQAVRASRFTSSDLVRIEPVEYRGLIWCVKVPTGAFVARRNGKVFVTGNSGFPKSLDVGKAIDKAAVAAPLFETIRGHIRHWRDALGWSNNDLNRAVGSVATGCGMARHWTSTEGGQHAIPSKDQWLRLKAVLGWPDCDLDAIYQQVKDGAERPIVGRAVYGDGHVQNSTVSPGYGWVPAPERDTRLLTAPATPAAQQWDGWGTALKPAVEHWWLARKPLDSTVAGTVTRWGTGALNIDGCRVRTTEDTSRKRATQAVGSVYSYDGMALGGTGSSAGRWPADVVLSHNPSCDGVCSPGCAVAELDQQSGTSTSIGGSRGGRPTFEDYRLRSQPDVKPGFGDTGGASRYFATFKYQAKPSTREKNNGLDDRNHHPTCKPSELMRWLCRLVTPPGGTVLDPFAGSGTTGVAAILEGFDVILVEAEAEYLELIEGRVRWAEQQVEQPALSFD